METVQNAVDEAASDILRETSPTDCVWDVLDDYWAIWHSFPGLLRLDKFDELCESDTPLVAVSSISCAVVLRLTNT